MIFTSYLKQLEKILKIEDAKVYIIMRYFPKNLEKYRSLGYVTWLPELSPNEVALASYHKNADLKVIRDNIYFNYHTNPDITSIYMNIFIESQSRPVFLLCCEEEDFMCHRSVVAEIFDNIYGAPVVEWQKKTSKFNKIVDFVKGRF